MGIYKAIIFSVIIESSNKDVQNPIIIENILFDANLKA